MSWIGEHINARRKIAGITMFYKYIWQLKRKI